MSADIRYDPSFFDRLPALESESFWFQGRNEIIAWALARYFPLAKDVCDIGCGTGFVLAGLSRRLPQLRLHALEAFPEAVRFARARVPQARFVVADAKRLPFTAAFDVLGTFDVLEHIPDDRNALEEMRGVLKPKGGILLTVPQHPRLWNNADVRAGHMRRYTRAGLRRLVESTGFEILLETGFVSLLFPAMAAARAVSGRRPEADALAGLALPRLFNASFAAVMAGEMGLIKRGIRFPFGGSLLVAGRKR